MPTVAVFTPRSIGIGVAAGVLVAGALGHLGGADWRLVILNSLAAGALALAGYNCMRDGRFGFLLENTLQRRLGVGMSVYAAATMAAPMVFVEDAIGSDLFNPGDGRALSLLFGFTASATFFLGGIMVTLAYLDGAGAGADPRLHRVAPPPGEPGPRTALRVFTARTTGIGLATGVLVAVSLGQLPGAAWGVAILNGLAAYALAQALSIDDLHGGWLGTTDYRRRDGIRALAYTVMLAPTLFVHHSIELRPADEVGLTLLFLLTGFAAYRLGCILATLAYLDGDADAAGVDPRLHRITPPPAERRGS